MRTRVNECSVKYFTCLSSFLGYLSASSLMLCFVPSAPVNMQKLQSAREQFSNYLQKISINIFPVRENLT